MKKLLSLILLTVGFNFLYSDSYPVNNKDPYCIKKDGQYFICYEKDTTEECSPISIKEFKEHLEELIDQEKKAKLLLERIKKGEASPSEIQKLAIAANMLEIKNMYRNLQLSKGFKKQKEISDPHNRFNLDSLNNENSLNNEPELKEIVSLSQRFINELSEGGARVKIGNLIDPVSCLQLLPEKYIKMIDELKQYLADQKI